MKIIMGGRGFGKTTRLIQMSAESGATIVTFSKVHKDEILFRADNMGLHIPTPITANEINNVRYLIHKNIVIDDLDRVLQQFLAPLEIDAVTMGYENVERMKTPVVYCCPHGYTDELDCPDCGH